MSSKEIPCYQCPNRTITCHIDCVEYTQFVVKNEQRKKVIQEKKADERAYNMHKRKALKRWDRKK